MAWRSLVTRQNQPVAAIVSPSATHAVAVDTLPR